MLTKRFDFADGDWWEVYTQKTWAAERAVARVARGFLKMDGAGIDAKTGELTGEVSLDPEKWDPDAANEALLLASTVSWSHGPINAATLAGVPINQARQVLAYLDEVYPQQDPLANGRTASGSRSSSSSPSSGPRRPFLRRWLTRIPFTRRDGRRTSSTPSP